MGEWGGGVSILGRGRFCGPRGLPHLLKSKPIKKGMKLMGVKRIDPEQS